jgi:hypothetical protein
MTEDLATRRRPVPIAIVALLALLGALLVTATGHDHADADEGMGHEHVMTTATAQDASYASPAGMAMDHAKTARLITRKQARFHDAMRKLWEDHVTWTRLAIVTFAAGTPGFDTTAARLLQNQVDIGDAINEANKRWYTNANAVADFLHKANPSNWGKKMMRQDMRVHLDQTLREAADELGGKYAAGVREYDHVHKHILKMADMLSSGIIAQFPGRFR